MARRNKSNKYQESRYRWNLGIHQQPNFAKPDHVKDALNVWAPEGEVRLRPGLVNVPGDFYCRKSTPEWDEQAGGDLRVLRYDTTGGSYTEENTILLYNLDAGDYLYFGVTSDISDAPAIPRSRGVQGNLITAVPTTGLFGALQYWNGSAWRNIPCSPPELAELSLVDTYTYLQTLCFKTPSDWALSTVNSIEALWVRLYVSKDPAGAGNYSWQMTWIEGHYSNTTENDVVLLGVRTFHTSRGAMSLLIHSNDSGSGDRAYRAALRLGLRGSSFISRHFATLKTYDIDDLSDSDPLVGDVRKSISGPAKIVYAEELGRIFVALGYSIYEFNTVDESYWYDPDTTSLRTTRDLDADKDQSAGMATPEGSAYMLAPESDQLLVGPNTPYYHEYLAQEGEAPNCSSIEYFDERLFFCGFRDQPRRIQWSMEGIYYRIFSVLAYTYVPGPTEPLLGFFKLGQNLYTYDAKSIWKISYTNTDNFGVPHYEALQVVAGLGPMAPNSIVNYVGGVLFLSYDGLIAFDGVRARQVSEYRSGGQTTDRLANLWRRVNWAATARYSTAVDWKDRGHYLVTLCLDDDRQPRNVLVWDYENNSLWLWDMPIAALFDYSMPGGRQRIMAVDDGYQIAELTDRHSDFEEAISATITPHRLGQGQAGTQRIRQIELTTDTDKGRIQVEIGVQDSATKATLTYDPYDETGAETLDSEKFIPTREKSICKEVKKTGERFDIKLSSLDTDEDFLIRDVYVRWVPLGTRAG